MLSTVLQTLMTPRYPRRYVGRHRARIALRLLAMVMVPRRPE
jgi:hypothetical protein